jgi:hypothetical protein
MRRQPSTLRASVRGSTRATTSSKCPFSDTVPWGKRRPLYQRVFGAAFSAPFLIGRRSALGDLEVESHRVSDCAR